MRESPTVETLTAFCVVFAAQQLVGLVGVGYRAFALAPPLLDAPWTLVTSSYAHASLPHLLGNAIALGAIGLAVEQTSTRARFHVFFLLTGALASSIQVLVDGLLGSPTAVLGASGAVFAFLGYAVTGNPAARAALARVSLDRSLLLLLGALLAGVVTLFTAAPQVALTAHFAGFFAGLVAGTRRVLHAGAGRRLADRPKAAD